MPTARDTLKHELQEDSTPQGDANGPGSLTRPALLQTNL